jgi:cytidine deaminase
MEHRTHSFSFDVYDSIAQLDKDDAFLLKEAQKAIESSYAPYSRFKVGAAAKLSNGTIVTGSNQENASFPVGLCAERVLIGIVSANHPQQPIDTIAISYQNQRGASNHPIAPCGLCRQSLQEIEGRLKHPIRLILGGMEGEVFVISNVSSLLPLAFGNNELK